MSGSSGSTSGSALSSNSSGKEEKFTDILKTTKENGSHNETKLLTSKTKSKKYEQSDDLKWKRLSSLQKYWLCISYLYLKLHWGNLRSVLWATILVKVIFWLFPSKKYICKLKMASYFISARMSVKSKEFWISSFYSGNEDMFNRNTNLICFVRIFYFLIPAFAYLAIIHSFLICTTNIRKISFYHHNVFREA